MMRNVILTMLVVTLLLTAGLQAGDRAFWDFKTPRGFFFQDPPDDGTASVSQDTGAVTSGAGAQGAGDGAGTLTVTMTRDDTTERVFIPLGESHGNPSTTRVRMRFRTDAGNAVVGAGFASSAQVNTAGADGVAGLQFEGLANYPRHIGGAGFNRSDPGPTLVENEWYIMEFDHYPFASDYGSILYNGDGTDVVHENNPVRNGTGGVDFPYDQFAFFNEDCCQNNITKTIEVDWISWMADPNDIGLLTGPVVVIDESDGKTEATEGGATDSFTVALAADPGGPKSITLQPIVNSGDFSLDTTVLNFDSGNWSVGQPVTVTAVNDGDLEDLVEMGSIRVRDGDDAVDLIAVSTVDDETPTVDVSKTDVAVSEIGPSNDSYTLVLSSQPTDDVVVTVSDISDPNQVTVTDTVTFTNSDWSTPKTVTVTAIDDALAEEDPHFTTITHTVASNDGLYNGLAVNNVSVTITENDCGAWGFTAGDINLDCVTDLLDFAEITTNWLICTTTNAPGCVQL